MKIGIISDTHHYFDPRLPELFAGVGHILHAGDIGIPHIIRQLEAIAPVTAVLGNNDPGLNFKETETLTLAGRRFLLHHIVTIGTNSEILQRIVREQPDVVVFGHTHQRYERKIGATLYLNPGYAGKTRFNQPRSIALLHCNSTELRVEFSEL